jgi:hypothetical protein
LSIGNYTYGTVVFNISKTLVTVKNLGHSVQQSQPTPAPVIIASSLLENTVDTVNCQIFFYEFKLIHLATKISSAVAVMNFR